MCRTALPSRRQEVRVNFELRELIVTGIRPQDIDRDNSIEHSEIAEARIIYMAAAS